MKLDCERDIISHKVVAGTVQSRQDALDYITYWTFFLVQNPTYYGMEDMAEKGLNSFLSCVETGTDGQIMHITVLGRIASYYYLTYTTVRNFSETLKASMPVEEVVQVLVDATLFEEVSVLHNEDNLVNTKVNP